MTSKIQMVTDDSRGVGWGLSQALGGNSIGTFSKGCPDDFLSNIEPNPARNCICQIKSPFQEDIKLTSKKNDYVLQEPKYQCTEKTTLLVTQHLLTLKEFTIIIKEV